MKPIEPGCLALVIQADAHPEHVGKVTKVLRRIDERWEVDLLGVFNQTLLARSSQLLRIDGHGDETVNQEEDVEVNA